jgi:hypothetical protein
VGCGNTCDNKVRVLSTANLRVAYLNAKELKGVHLMEANVIRFEVVERPIAAGLGGTNEIHNVTSSFK